MTAVDEANDVLARLNDPNPLQRATQFDLVLALQRLRTEHEDMRALAGAGLNEIALDRDRHERAALAARADADRAARTLANVRAVATTMAAARYAHTIGMTALQAAARTGACDIADAVLRVIDAPEEAPARAE